MSKKGSGPPVQVTSKPTPPLDGEAAAEAEALAFPDETLADDQPDILDLLSSVMPNGLDNPYAATENGWAVGPQPVDPSSGAPGPSGPLAAYVGANVEACSGEAVGAEANAAAGGPATDPYETSQTLEELWNALGRTSVDMSQAVADNSNTGSASNQTATDATQAAASRQTIQLGDGNVLVVEPNGVASVYDAQGNQIYNTFSFQNGGGYFFQSTDLSSPNVLFFNNPTDIANAQQPTIAPVDTLTPAIEAAAQGRDLMAAIIDSVSTPTTPADAPPSGIAEVLGDGASGQGQQSAQPGASPGPAPQGPTGPSQDDQNWDAAKAGMWDSFVDMVGGAVNGLLAPMGPPGGPGQFGPQIPFDWAKFGPPASTGNATRDADRLDNYQRGGWVTKTIALALPIGAEGILDSGLAAANRISPLGEGGGLGGEIGSSLGPELQTLKSEQGVNVVSPVYRLAGRDVVVVDTPVGRQAFYRSTGYNSGQPNKWLPVDEIRPADGWFNKTSYTQASGFEPESPLFRLGSDEFAKISDELGKMELPQGQVVPAGVNENASVTMNRILDFFNARITPATFFRPVPE
jgi:hypothetical protein